MNLDPAEMILYALTAAAIVAWLCALQFMLNTTRRQKSPAEQEQEVAQLGTTAPTNLIAGSVEIEGAAADLAARSAAILAKQGSPTLGSVKILERTAERVVFEGMPGLGQGAAGQLMSRGELRFTPLAQKRTRVDYAVEVPPRAGLLLVGWLFIGLGLLAIGVGFALIQFYALNDPNPEVHWQSVQMVQVVHFIWPPFLFGGLYRRLRTSVRTTFETFVNNLPYLEA